mmetsp:Transcript_16568/g.55741  ORF Transcript_16568/g.55741 Transcript_16568/m.55741 type:complete len:135 (-) Transcript_16568:213-617(-)
MGTPARELCAALLQREPHERLGSHKDFLEVTPARFLADVDWLALMARALPAPVRPVVAPADPLELSAIEALLLGGTHHMGRASESDDPFVAAAAARHLFDHDFEPCDEEAPGGKPMRFELPKPQAALARQQPRL